MEIKLKKSSPDVGIKTNQVNINMKATGGLGTKDHSKLSNLDYEHSGHTGFASAEQIQELLDKLNEKQNTLTAGDNISIVDDIISVTGLDKNEIYIGPDEPTDPNVKIWIDTNEVAEEFYTKEEIDEKGFATEDWVSAQGYLKEHQDLSEYALKSELSDKQDKLTAGKNITIEDNVISSVGGSELPVYPENNGNYNLVVQMNNGVPTLQWITLNGVWQLPTQMSNDLKIFQCVTINQIKNGLEVY